MQISGFKKTRKKLNVKVNPQVTEISTSNSSYTRCLVYHKSLVKCAFKNTDSTLLLNWLTLSLLDQIN